jgi:EAL domain-containing protein (putative c-di-GMP-specific phosphodiesterase class I)
LNNDDGELILPGAFIPAAERYGLMVQLDRWVITSALSWLAENPELTSILYKCSINLSGHSIGNENFLDFVKSKISELNIDPSKICFEITETAAISNLIKATEFISELNAKGCSFALDDFGSGFSSFAYLKNLPVDFIKIDGMFVRDIDHDSIDQEMVRSITNIAKSMGKQTIAEFVENDTIKNILEGFGVDYIQGYGVAKPESLESLTVQRLGLAHKISQAR